MRRTPVQTMQGLTPRGYQPPAEEKVIEEACNLLNQLEFSAERGAYAVGDHVAVTIDPRWNATEQALEVRILCHAFEHWLVDFDGGIVWVEESKENTEKMSRGKGWCAFLDRWGRARLKLNMGDYTGGYTASLALHAEKCGVLPAVGFGGSPADEASRDQESAKILEYGSPEAWLHVLVRREPRGEIHIRFETQRPELADATVRLALVSKDTNEVTFRGEVQLEVQLFDMAAEAKRWGWTWWESVDLFQKEQALVVQLVPANN